MRGVQQGDPLSCLLFNIAIESLATALRNSDIRDFRILSLQEKLVTLLFADNNMVVLSKEDSFDELEEVLKKWCKGSGAKFNIEKTEVISIGPKLYSRRMRERDESIQMT